MLRFRFILIAAAFLTAAPLFAQTSAPASFPSAARSSEKLTAVPFRIGTIYSAEIGKVKPSFDEESPFDEPAVENPVWVELIVKIDNGRSISRFDYELVCRTGTYACFAVAEGNEGYSVNPEKWTIKKTTNLKYYRLLFPVNRSELDGTKNLLPATLKMKLYTTTLPQTDFQLRVMPDGVKFTGVSRIPQDGICNLSYQELPSSVR